MAKLTETERKLLQEVHPIFAGILLNGRLFSDHTGTKVIDIAGREFIKIIRKYLK